MDSITKGKSLIPNLELLYTNHTHLLRVLKKWTSGQIKDFHGRINGIG